MRKPSLLRRRSKSAQNNHEPDTNPVTDLMIADIVIRSISSIARDTAKKSLARKRFDRETADQLTARGSLGKTLLLYGASKIASRSLPGAVFVGGALLTKTALDRKKSNASSKRAERTSERVGERHRAALLDREK